MTNLIEGCNQNVSNYLNRLDILTSNITRDTDNNYIIDTNIIPKENLTYDLGSVENKFKDLYIGPNSIWFGDTHKMSVSGDKIKMKKLKTDVVPNGLVNKLDISAEEIKQDIIDKIGQSDGGNSGGGDSILFGCGENSSGQLGLGDRSNRNLLNIIDYFNDNNIIIDDISSGWHTLFLDKDGNVYGSGLNDYGRLGLGNPITSTTHTNQYNYTYVNSISITSTTITKISVGVAHSLFLTNSYQVYSCGYNNNGQLGIGGTTTQYNPVNNLFCR